MELGGLNQSLVLILTYFNPKNKHKKTCILCNSLLLCSSLKISPMSKMASYLSILSLLCIILLIVPNEAKSNGTNNHVISPLIQKTCKTTKYYDLCVSSLKSDPTSPKADTKGLAVIMVGVGMANATATSTYLSSQVLSNTRNDTVLKTVLKECSDKYSYAGNSLQSSLQNVMDEAYDYAYMDVMAAADYPNACHNAFKRYPGLVYPPEIATRENGLKHLCDVVMGIINILGAAM